MLMVPGVSQNKAGYICWLGLMLMVPGFEIKIKPVIFAN